MKKAIILFVTLVCGYFQATLSGQTLLKGIVKDDSGIPVFAANVYFKSDLKHGTITDFDGNFTLKIPQLAKADTLICSFIGMETHRLPLDSIPKEGLLLITMRYQPEQISTIVVESSLPIAREFAVTQMDMIEDVYANPVAQADPLKAISILPASTTIDETANVELRGSAAGRSVVVLNGVPVSNPVRAADLNNQGFFSLFNPEIIKRQYVYASNPPLMYGNTSGGLVEIQTKEAAKNDLRLSLGLANVGIMGSLANKKQTSLFQAYANLQTASAFVALQKDKLPDIDDFLTTDFGFNYFTKLSWRISVNTYNYLLRETFQGAAAKLNFRGNVNSKRQRLFSVNNIRYRSKSDKLHLSVNNGISRDRSTGQFGNTVADNRFDELYHSMDIKWFALLNTTFQVGVSHQWQKLTYNASVPAHFFASRPTDPVRPVKGKVLNQFMEMYWVTNWEINERFSFYSGSRWKPKTFFSNENYSSGQMSFKYNSKKGFSSLLSGGVYHNYTPPRQGQSEFSLVKASQLAIDMDWQFDKSLIKAAAYLKKERGRQFTDNLLIEKLNTLGFELFFETEIGRFLRFNLSNSFLRQRMAVTPFGQAGQVVKPEKKYPGPRDLAYLSKVTLQYNNSKLFSASLVYFARPGSRYTPVTGSAFRQSLNNYQPTYDQNLFGRQYNPYNRLDLSFSKFVSFKSGNLLFYFNVNNILNTKNQRQVTYNQDYTSHSFDFYMLRTLYFGAVWNFE